MRSSEMCTRPSTPGSNSTNAPNSMIFDTVPRCVVPTGNFRSYLGPRVFGKVAQGQADLVRVGIDLAHKHFYRLAKLQHVARMLYALPGKLAHVKQSIDATQINKGSKGLQASDHAFPNLPLGQFVEHTFFARRLFTLDHRPAG